ncbi:hypothetical protein D030_3169B, partial [Vibrio parahaemolyticus AQ3810]
RTRPRVTRSTLSKAQ